MAVLKSLFEKSFQEFGLSEKDFIRRVEGQSDFLERTKIEDVTIVDNEVLVVSGTYWWGYEYPYLAIISKQKDAIHVLENCTLLGSHGSHRNYYFWVRWQKHESSANGMLIYRLDEKGLAKATDLFW